MQKKLNQNDNPIKRYGLHKEIAKFWLFFLYNWVVFD
jgi:hypothetical protein